MTDILKIAVGVIIAQIMRAALLSAASLTRDRARYPSLYPTRELLSGWLNRMFGVY